MRKILGNQHNAKDIIYLIQKIHMLRKKNNRKHYSQDVRKLLYDNAKGKCAICGKHLLFRRLH